MMLNVTKRPKRAPANAPSTKILLGEMNTSILTAHRCLVTSLFNAENRHGVGLVESTDTLHSRTSVYFAMYRLRGASSRGHHAWITGGFTTSRCSKCWNRTGSHFFGLATTEVSGHRTNLIKPSLVFGSLLFSRLAFFRTGFGVYHHFAFACLTIQVFQL